MLPTIKRVAVLGGGSSGAVAAKCLLAEGLTPVIFEQRSSFGGAWNYTPETKAQLQHVPQEDPNFEDEPVVNKDSGDTNKSVFMTPMYAALETNLPKDIMTFNNTPFREDLQLYPKHEDVRHYVLEYSKGLENVTKFNKRVVKLSKQEDMRWIVGSQDVITQRVEEEIFDAAVIATGHYNVPYIPPIAGIERFEEKYPGSVRHSKYFRTVDEYEGKVLPNEPI
ncbi:hypothetical protein ABW20_dc0102095 [Dactylellina cionopaga]|nr:hypothetical protein ABW20_dc0102095 [Dactylellina cionopaga]